MKLVQIDSFAYLLDKVSEARNKKVMNVRLGMACNEDCIFCTVSKDKEINISFDGVKDKISKFVASGGTDITFTGGEPTLRKDLLMLISNAKKLGVKKVSIQTNGVKLSDKDYLLELVDSGLDSVMIGFHSHKEEDYIKLTKSELFLGAVNGIKMACNNNLDITIYCVINSINKKYLIDFVNFLRNISTNIKFAFAFVRPNGNAEDNSWIVPKLSDIEFDLQNLFTHFRNEKVPFIIEGVPLCYMPCFEYNCAEVYRKLINSISYSNTDGSYADLHGNIQNSLKIKSDTCKICKVNKWCDGVWREYANLFGTDELVPVFKSLEGLDDNNNA